jgi:hypothetical protein
MWIGWTYRTVETCRAHAGPGGVSVARRPTGFKQHDEKHAARAFKRASPAYGYESDASERLRLSQTRFTAFDIAFTAMLQRRRPQRRSANPCAVVGGAGHAGQVEQYARFTPPRHPANAASASTQSVPSPPREAA